MGVHVFIVRVRVCVEEREYKGRDLLHHVRLYKRQVRTLELDPPSPNEICSKS